MLPTESENKERPCWIDFWHEGKFSECSYGYEIDCHDCERYRNDDDLK